MCYGLHARRDQETAAHDLTVTERAPTEPIMSVGMHFQLSADATRTHEEIDAGRTDGYSGRDRRQNDALTSR
nr:hypothetical protein CFP56_10072 [Quercus suber]